MKKLETGIKGWSDLKAGKCRLVNRFRKHYRCIAYVPCSSGGKKHSLDLSIDLNLKSGSVSLYNVQNGGLGEHENGRVVPTTYDFWSDLRDQILAHSKVNCSIHWGKEPNNCDISVDW